MSLAGERLISHKANDDVLFGCFGENDLLCEYFFVFVDGLKGRARIFELTFVVVISQHVFKIILMLSIC